MVQCTHKWWSVMSNNFAEHQTLYLNIILLSNTRNISMLWRIVELVCGVTWRLSRRNHQKYKPPMEQWSAGGHEVIECEDRRETIVAKPQLKSESLPSFSAIIRITFGNAVLSAPKLISSLEITRCTLFFETIDIQDVLFSLWPPKGQSQSR